MTEATTYVPAAETGEIWAFDYSGGRLGAGDLTLRRVDLNGNVTFSTEDFDTNQGWPLLGLPGGLALATDSGIAGSPCSEDPPDRARCRPAAPSGVPVDGAR